MMDRLDEKVLETGRDPDDEETVPERGAVCVFWRFFGFK